MRGSGREGTAVCCDSGQREKAGAVFFDRLKKPGSAQIGRFPVFTVWDLF